MKRFAAAYGRALFPSRYGLAKSTTATGTRVDGEHSMTLQSGALELDIGAGIYRLVRAGEALLDGLRRHRLGARADTERRPTVTPLGCG